MTEDSEPTWGENLTGSAPADRAPQRIPNQRSMPVVGRSVPPAAQSHADYRRQAAQHFGTSPGQPVPPVVPMSYPAAPSTGYPVVPQPPHFAVPPSRAAYPPAPPRDSFVTRIMERGVQGALLRQPWFQDQRHRNPDPFVYITFGVGVAVSVVLMFIPSSFVVTVLTTLLWVGIGYSYFALGTKVAHQFIEFGICLVGGLIMLLRVFSAIVGLSVSRPRYQYGAYAEPPVVLMVVLLLNIAGVAAAAYIGVQVHRGIRKMSQP